MVLNLCEAHLVFDVDVIGAVFDGRGLVEILALGEGGWGRNIKRGGRLKKGRNKFPNWCRRERHKSLLVQSRGLRIRINLLEDHLNQDEGSYITLQWLQWTLFSHILTNHKVQPQYGHSETHCLWTISHGRWFVR